jgi:hypothetical protein
MTTDELNLSSGRWIRREKLITDMLTEYADEDDLNDERIERIIDEMIEDDDILQTMERNGEQYIQLRSLLTAFSYVGKKDPSQLPGMVHSTFNREFWES